MDTNYKRFMELTTPVISETDKVWNNLLGDLILAMDVHFQIPTGQFENIHEYALYSKAENPEILYFWEWMDGKGFDLLKGLDVRLPNSDEINEFLNYRKVILEMDASSGSLEVFLVSITELLLTVSDFIATYFETAVTVVSVTEEPISLPDHRFESNVNSWKVIESSAATGAGLLLYA